MFYKPCFGAALQRSDLHYSASELSLAVCTCVLVWMCQSAYRPMCLGLSVYRPMCLGLSVYFQSTYCSSRVGLHQLLM